jgi:hypothetical protein
MAIPKGFLDLVKLTMKERPTIPKTMEGFWDKFLFVIFMGGKRSEPEIRFIINMLNTKKLVDLEYVAKTDGDDWRDAVNDVINERLQRIQDDDIKVVLKEFQKEIFRISASIKGSARFLKKLTVEELVKDVGTKDTTRTFIENMANNQDVSNIKYTKIIIWLHSVGLGYDFCPPGWQVKKFINNDVGPYYQFYEDDKYFMTKAEEFSEEIKKKIKDATARDVSMAIFYYITLKGMLPLRSAAKKNCTPDSIVKFVKKMKLSLNDISNMLSEFEGREKLIDDLYKFLMKS